MKEVLLSIEGIQYTPTEEQNEVVLMTHGTLLCEQDKTTQSDKITLSYEETETTGMEGTSTQVIVQNGCVTLSRQGAVSTQMVFEQGKKHISLYQTLHGALTVGVFASAVRTNFDKDGGNILVDYALDVDNEQISHNIFKIQYKSSEISGEDLPC